MDKISFDFFYLLLKSVLRFTGLWNLGRKCSGTRFSLQKDDFEGKMSAMVCNIGTTPNNIEQQRTFWTTLQTWIDKKNISPVVSPVVPNRISWNILCLIILFNEKCFNEKYTNIFYCKNAPQTVEFLANCPCVTKIMRS